jgi:hypothetical protein
VVAVSAFGLTPLTIACEYSDEARFQRGKSATSSMEFLDRGTTRRKSSFYLIGNSIVF